MKYFLAIIACIYISNVHGQSILNGPNAGEFFEFQPIDFSNTSLNGAYNVLLGYQTGAEIDDDLAGNVMIGALAGSVNNGSGNIFIGNAAGQYNTSSNTLIISNNSSTPILFGNMSNNQLAVGTTQLPSNTDYILAVGGKAIATEMKVTAINNWPDFVFDKSYNVRSIHELQKFIEENNHLPNIPSAKEVELDGIELGEMNTKILQTIEELTLYIIDLNKQMEDHRKEIDELKSLLRNK